MSREADSALAMQNIICRHLREEHGLTERYASELAAAAMRALTESYGGERIYIPKPDKEGPTGAGLKARYKGTQESRDALCKEYGLSTSAFYRKLGEGGDG